MFKKAVFLIAIVGFALAPALALAHGTSEPTADEGWYNQMTHHGAWSVMGGFIPWGLFLFVCWVISVVVGVLIIIWLWQKVTEKK